MDRKSLESVVSITAIYACKLQQCWGLLRCLQQRSADLLSAQCSLHAVHGAAQRLPEGLFLLVKVLIVNIIMKLLY